VTPVKTQAIAPLVLKANKVLLVHHHLVVDGEDLTAILVLKPLVAVDGEDHNVLQLPLVVDGVLLLRKLQARSLNSLNSLR
jgi:hypothetical protein